MEANSRRIVAWIYAGGRFNSPAEANYAPIEGELLGIVVGRALVISRPTNEVAERNYFFLKNHQSSSQSVM